MYAQLAFLTICQYTGKLSIYAGIAIRHLQGRILFYTAGSRNGLERAAGHGAKHKKEVVPKKKILYFFVIEKYIEDARQDEKHVPDLLEPIIQPPCLVKEELRQILIRMIQIRSKFQKI